MHLIDFFCRSLYKEMQWNRINIRFLFYVIYVQYISSTTFNNWIKWNTIDSMHALHTSIVISFSIWLSGCVCVCARLFEIFATTSKIQTKKKICMKTNRMGNGNWFWFLVYEQWRLVNKLSYCDFSEIVHCNTELKIELNQLMKRAPKK